MSLDGLLKTKVDLYRASDVPDQYGDPSLPVLVARSLKIRVDDPLRLRNSDAGPGGSVDGQMVMLTTKRWGRLLQVNDIVRYVSGLELPWPMWRIMDIFKPSPNTLQMWIEPFKGKLG